MGIFSDIFGSAYSVYQDQRNYNYNRDLQEEMFRRDDTAMQRRMADYQQAGINPLLALGASGAGVSSAGGPSGASITPLGSPVHDAIARKNAREEQRLQIDALNTANAEKAEDLKKKKTENKILEKQYEAMEEAGYYPFSWLGKAGLDANSVLGNIFGKLFGIDVNPINPDVNLKQKIQQGIDSISPVLSQPIPSPKAIDKFNKKVDEIKSNAQHKKELKLQKDYIKDHLHEWNKNFTYKNYSLVEFNNYLRILDKRKNELLTPQFTNFEGAVRFMKYGSR